MSEKLKKMIVYLEEDMNKCQNLLKFRKTQIAKAREILGEKKTPKREKVLEKALSEAVQIAIEAGAVNCTLIGCKGYENNCHARQLFCKDEAMKFFIKSAEESLK